MIKVGDQNKIVLHIETLPQSIMIPILGCYCVVGIAIRISLIFCDAFLKPHSDNTLHFNSLISPWQGSVLCFIYCGIEGN